MCLMLLLMNSMTVSAQDLVKERHPVELNTTEGLDTYIHWNGTGIIMYVAPMPDGVNSSVWFGVQ